MTINTWNTKEQSNGLNLEQLIRELWTHPIKFYVERKKNYWYFLNDEELQTLQSQNNLYLYKILEWWIKTEIKKTKNKDCDISWMINYLLYASGKIPEPISANFNFLVIHKLYNELYEEKNKFSDLKKYIWIKYSNILKILTN